MIQKKSIPFSRLLIERVLGTHKNSKSMTLNPKLSTVILLALILLIKMIRSMYVCEMYSGVVA